MKTPRDLLFERHRAAETKLDAVRESVVATLGKQNSAKEISTRAADRSRLRDLLLTLRWHLAGLSAAWLVVLLLNLTSAPDQALNIAREKTPSPRQLFASLEAYRRQLTELLDTPPVEPAAPPPRRSERAAPTEIV